MPTFAMKVLRETQQQGYPCLDSLPRDGNTTSDFHSASSQIHQSYHLGQDISDIKQKHILNAVLKCFTTYSIKEAFVIFCP